MTGFAAVTREDDRATIAVTIRALNHRYLDLQLRIPQVLAALESDVRALVAKRIARGRVELSLSIQVRQMPGVEVEFNEEFGRALSAALDAARSRGLVAGALTPGDLLRLPQALTIRERQSDADAPFQAELAARALEYAPPQRKELSFILVKPKDGISAEEVTSPRAAMAELNRRPAPLLPARAARTATGDVSATLWARL